ncbi:MAG: hypothetical protein COU46_00610 [Candidatus Niyogibacteria bacterium CG10_big_fil_rev_8_21_14_0_10_42_19]|uniref:Uncharacterized protein n=1 Tax=Candidatus Niyogibacteria bacterium CG10_big_fil_rev_8_21_14_0_10_42_19 TaxID=1974725 RepID=A0A2H0TGD3_9BACT|nr:MAG: hypothetical protein COU46_00610 [Candidatus Niyogibacteria bacterium CG10_big_fil_rev_8_21_14_0_10_42_19]
MKSVRVSPYRKTVPPFWFRIVIFFAKRAGRKKPRVSWEVSPARRTDGEYLEEVGLWMFLKNPKPICPH